MASVTLGDCKQGLQWGRDKVEWWVGATHLVLGLNINQGNMHPEMKNNPDEVLSEKQICCGCQRVVFQHFILFSNRLI